jgi:hypothetical protein
VLKTLLGFFKELNRYIDIFMLSRGENSQYGVLDWVELVCKSLDKHFVQGEQVRVSMKGFLLKVAN